MRGIGHATSVGLNANRADYATAIMAVRPVNYSLRIDWRLARELARSVAGYALRRVMSPESLQMLLSLALGFAVAGLIASTYRLATQRLPSFSMLQAGPGLGTFAMVPLLVMSAPFLIMRNTLRGRRHEGRRFEFVFMATLIAGFWSLMSGTVLVTTLQACGLLLV